MVREAVHGEDSREAEANESPPSSHELLDALALAPYAVRSSRGRRASRWGGDPVAPSPRGSPVTPPSGNPPVAAGVSVGSGGGAVSKGTALVPADVGRPSPLPAERVPDMSEGVEPCPRCRGHSTVRKSGFSFYCRRCDREFTPSPLSGAEPSPTPEDGRNACAGGRVE